MAQYKTRRTTTFVLPDHDVYDVLVVLLVVLAVVIVVVSVVTLAICQAALPTCTQLAQLRVCQQKTTGPGPCGFR
jgi:biopolymer transport protein ExbD